MAQFQPQGSCFHNPFTKDGTATSGRHCDFRLHLRLLPEASIAYVATKYDGIGDWWVKFRFFQLVISNVYNVCWWNCIFRYSHLILILSNKRAILKTFTDGVLSEILHPFAFLWAAQSISCNFVLLEQTLTIHGQLHSREHLVITDRIWTLQDAGMADQ